MMNNAMHCNVLILGSGILRILFSDWFVKDVMRASMTEINLLTFEKVE